MITILATICGADTWIEINEFGRAKYEWFKTFLELPNGIPSHDTFSRVFALIDPQKFEAYLYSWIKSLAIDCNNEIIAIDGKTLRGSGNRRQGQRPLHLVSAWATTQNLLLGQIQTAEKSNEITAIPYLLKRVNLKGSIVTIEAMGCQSSIAQEIKAQGAEYILNLKENQPKLYEIVEAIFEMGQSRQYKKMLHRRKVEKVHDHGRIETRRYTLISARDPTVFQLRWPSLKGLGLLEVTRTTNNQVAYSKRYFLSSLVYENIDDFTKAVRKHWSIEINLHWSLDVSFKEDLNRARAGHSAQNLATVRRIVLSLLTREKNHKRGMAAKRKTAGWNHKYLMEVLETGSQNNI